MDNTNLIKKAYKYYDEQHLKYENIVNKINTWQISNTELDLQKPIINFFDKDKKLIFKSNLEFMGSYYEEQKLWVWAWADPNIPKNETYLVTKLLKYGCDINVKDNKNDKKQKFLKMILTNSRFKVENQVSLDIIGYLALYLSKKDWIFYVNDNKNSTLKFFFLYNLDIN